MTSAEDPAVTAYLYLLLSSLYTYAIYATSLAARALLCSTCCCWRWPSGKAQRPPPLSARSTAAPPPRGRWPMELAALLFFVLQAVIALFLVGKGEGDRLRSVIAFLVAGAPPRSAPTCSPLTRASGVPRLYGPGPVGRSSGSGRRMIAAARRGGLPSPAGAFSGAQAALERASCTCPNREPGWCRWRWWPPDLRGDHLPGLVFGGLRRSVRFSYAAGPARHLRGRTSTHRLPGGVRAGARRCRGLRTDAATAAPWSPSGLQRGRPRPFARMTLDH